MKYLLIFLSVLQISDGVITHFAVRNGLVQEGNHLIESMVREGNFMLPKVIGVLLSVFILWGIYKFFPKIALTATASIVVFYGIVMAWNLSRLFRA